MIKVTLLKSLNVRSGQVPLRFRLRDGDDVDLLFDTGRMVEADDLAVFSPDGKARARLHAYNPQLKRDVDGYMFAMNAVYLEMVQGGVQVDEESFRRAMMDRLGEGMSLDPVSSVLVERFRSYLDEELAAGRISEKIHRDSMTVSRKLERFLAIREFGQLEVSEFTGQMLVEFEKFCIDEYLYASNPKYLHLYPRDYEGSRLWPKHKMNERVLAKMLIRFQTFWNDLVLFGEIERSPYEDYVAWMKPKKYKSYVEVMGEPVSLTGEEFQRVMTSPFPEDLAEVRNMFVLQACLGCRGDVLAKIRLSDIRVSKKGVPYVCYKPAVDKMARNELKAEFLAPLVRAAYDIMMRTRCEFYFGAQNASYNRRIKELLRFCGIVREVSVFNERTGETEQVPLCELMSNVYVRTMHVDIVGKAVMRPEIAHAWTTSDRASVTFDGMKIEERFKMLNKAFGQRPFRVDENLNIIEGAPFVAFDDLVYKVQPEKLPSCRTNPYVISELVAAPEGSCRRDERVEVRYGKVLARERKLAVCGTQVTEFLESLEDEHRVQIWYGLMLLKKLSDFKVTFVRDWEETVYELRCAIRGYVYSVYFYLNGETIVLLRGCLDEKHRRHKATGTGNLPHVQELRWKNVIGEVEAVEYDSVLDERFGESGTVKREVYEMRACSSYVSQALRQIRLDAGLLQEEVFSRWGFKADCGNMTHAETGFRVLPYKYLARLLEAFGLKAIIVRPGLEGWNAISYTMTLEQMLESIGEPVKNWRKKNKN